MSNNSIHEEFKTGLIVALVSGLILLLIALGGIILTRLWALDEITRTQGERIARLETCSDCSKGPRVKNKGGYEWKEYASEEIDDGGNVTFAVKVDVLEKRYRWACGRSGEDDIVRENQDEDKVNLGEIIRKYEPGVELKGARNIVVIGTASQEGDVSSQADLAEARARTLVSLVEDNIQKKITIRGMSFGQYVADRKTGDCSNATSEQRRVLIVKVMYPSERISDEALEKSLIARFKQLADEESYDFPVDIGDYSNYRQRKKMLLD